MSSWFLSDTLGTTSPTFSGPEVLVVVFVFGDAVETAVSSALGDATTLGFLGEVVCAVVLSRLRFLAGTVFTHSFFQLRIAFEKLYSFSLQKLPFWGTLLLFLRLLLLKYFESLAFSKLFFFVK